MPSAPAPSQNTHQSNGASAPEQNAAAAAQSSGGNDPKDGKTKPITAAAKEDLHDYFESLNWPLNKDLPRGDYASDLDKIVKKYGLKKTQVSRQLKNYKNAKYGLSQIKIILKEGVLEAKIRAGMSMSTKAFVSDTLSKLLSKSSSNSDFNNFCRVFSAFPEAAPTLVKLMDCPDNECFMLLIELVEDWIQYAAELFPRTAAGLSGSELKFQEWKRAQKRVFAMKWMEQHVNVGLDEEKFTKQKFGFFGLGLMNALFMNWSVSWMDSTRPAVEFPERCLVGKYARRVIYYCAGWTLYSMSRALTIAKSQRQIYFDFVKENTLDVDSAKEQGLPTSVVERRKRMSKMFCTKGYFEFICFLESIFLANLTLEMMLAYADGDLVYEIKQQTLQNEGAMSKFAALCNNDDSFSDDDLGKIMNYVIQRYTNMRGTYFVKHLRGTGGGGVDRLVGSQATRDKVKTAVACAKAAGEAKEKTENSAETTNEEEQEKQIWNDAAENVLECHDKEVANPVDVEPDC